MGRSTVEEYNSSYRSLLVQRRIADLRIRPRRPDQDCNRCNRKSWVVKQPCYMERNAAVPYRHPVRPGIGHGFDVFRRVEAVRGICLDDLQTNQCRPTNEETISDVPGTRLDLTPLFAIHRTDGIHADIYRTAQVRLLPISWIHHPILSHCS